MPLGLPRVRWGLSLSQKVLPSERRSVYVPSSLWGAVCVCAYQVLSSVSWLNIFNTASTQFIQSHAFYGLPLLKETYKCAD